MNKEFTSKPTYEDNSNNKHKKSNIKKFGDRIETDFHDNNKIPAEKIPCKCLSVIMLESVFSS